MKKILFLLVGVLMIALTGCATQKQSVLDGNLLSYDLGKGNLIESNEREIPYEIQGVLGIPQEKDCPVVVLIHGAHPIEKASESHYERGFDYLAQALSEQGNLVISMNVAINYSFEDGEPNGNERTQQVIFQQLELLKKAVDGDKTVFGYDLTDVGDFSNVVLMGHSRGGMDVLECADTLPEGMQTVGVVSVAPAFYKEMETQLPNVPVGIVIPEMDGDVISLDGSDFYEQFVEDPQYTKTAELIYLKNANHGYFNTQLTQPDLNHNDSDIDKLMPAEQQRLFLTQYLTEFVKSVTATGEPVFSSVSELESKAYNCDVLFRLHSGTETKLWSAENDGDLSCEGAVTATPQIASYLPDQNTVQLFKLPGGSSLRNYALSRIVWEQTDAAVTVSLNENTANCRFIDIDMAVDSTDFNNMQGHSMSLVFSDEYGNAEEYAVDRSAAALLWQEGELVEKTGWDGKSEQEYSTYTPLVTLRIDLSKLSAIDCSRLASIKMSWNESSCGSIMLRSISGVA